MDSMRFMANNPNTLKRQPTGSFKPVSAIGAQRQTIGVDKMASKADIVMAKLAKRDLPPFEKQDRPKKAKKVYHALKRDHPEYSAGKKARIANAVAAGTIDH